MAEIMQQNPDGTVSESIPEPFWVTRWFRSKPACYPCGQTFRDRAEHDRHWLDRHSVSSRTCDAKDGGYFCAARQGHGGDHHESCGGHRWPVDNPSPTAR